MLGVRGGSRRFNRVLTSCALSAAVVLSLAPKVPASAGVNTNGRIVFVEHDWKKNTRTVFLVDPDGTNLEELSPWQSEFLQPTWSPDGSEINIAGDACGVISQINCATAVVNPDIGDYRWLPADPIFFDCDQPCFKGGFGCFIWSPDGALLGCVGSSEADPTQAGIYTIRSSDGGDPTRIHLFDPLRRWEAFPAAKDFSPDGQQLLYMQVATPRRSGLYLTNLDGTNRRRITPVGMLWDHDMEATFSPDGQWILFTAFPDEDHKRDIFLVHPDGSGLHEAYPECGGRWDDPKAFGCGMASWSPDGTRIIYVRNHTTTSNIVMAHRRANTNGIDLQVILRGEGNVLPEFPDWGTHPIVP